MNKLWRIVLLFFVLAPVASIGILGCGGSQDTQPQQRDFDAAAIDAEAEAEQATETAPAPGGEPTTGDEGP